MRSCPACSTANPETSPRCSACGEAFEASLATSLSPAGRAAPAPDSDSAVHGRFLPGTKIADRYRIVSLAGRGGMGEVYRADDLKLGHPVALKFLPRDVAEGSRGFQFFLNEVRLARQIAHPNVCRVYDVAEVDGQHFLSMEYIDGEDLRGLRQRIGRLPSDKGIQVAQQLCAGLQAAHEKGVLHRDLKPANIMIDGRGQVRITDFGLARLADGAPGRGDFAGTPAYMAPEQLARGETTVQSDLYSLGLILYELFTGQSAHKGGSLQELVRSHEDSSPTLPSLLVADLDPAVERVILRCLQKEAGQRPRSARSVAAALPGGDPLAVALAAGETPSPEMVAAAGAQGAIGKRLGLACLAGVAVGLLLLCGLAQRFYLVNRAGLDRHPEFLAETARRIVQRLGYTDAPGDEAHGFFNEGRSAVRFWHRQSPRTMLADRYWNGWGEPSFARVTPSNPPLATPGELGVVLDPTGRLVRFRAVPPVPAGPPGREPDWPAWFPSEATGFDLAALQRIDDRGPRPEQPYDQLQAWRASGSAAAGGGFYVQAAAYGGRPVSFAVMSPVEFEARSPAQRSLMRQRGESVYLLLVLVVRIGGAVLAWRNVRLGRCDRRGTLRVALWVFALGMLAWLFRASHIAGGYEVAVLDIGFAQALWGAANFWILYAAVEPYVRRLWPQALISWSRLVDGRWRDPLVGRNLLLGVLAGVAGTMALMLQHLAPWFGLPPQPLVGSNALTLAGPAALAGYLIELLGQGPGQVFALVVLLFLRLVLRKPLLAAGAFIALMTVMYNLFTEGHPVLGWFAWLLGTSLLLWVLTHLGYLAMIGMIVTHQLLTQFPLTTDLSAWYAPSGLTAVLVVLGLAAFGFYTSQAGRPIFGPGPAEPSLG